MIKSVGGIILISKKKKILFDLRQVCILLDDLVEREIQTILINLFQVGVSFHSMMTSVLPSLCP